MTLVTTEPRGAEAEFTPARRAPVGSRVRGYGAHTAATLRERPSTHRPSYLRVVSSADGLSLPPTPPRARPGSGRRRRPTRVRLTTRGRIVVIVAAALTAAAVASVLLAAAAGWLGSSAGAAQDQHGGQPAQVITVQPGDTLWSLARGMRPGSSTWGTVHLLREANGLTDSVIHPGQVLVLPASTAE